jgi:hypothetical protein
MLALRETMALGKLVSKWGREKRVPGALWRRRDARGGFYMADEGDIRRWRGGGWRRNTGPIWLLILVIEERKCPIDDRGSKR